VVNGDEDPLKPRKAGGMDEMFSCLHDHTYDGVVADEIARHHPRPYFLRASDVIERNMWMRDIRKVCLDKPSRTHKPLHLLAKNKSLLFFERKRRSVSDLASYFCLASSGFPNSQEEHAEGTGHAKLAKTPGLDPRIQG